MQQTVPPAEFQIELDSALRIMIGLASVSKTTDPETARKCIGIVSNCNCIGAEAVWRFIVSLTHV